MLSQPLERRAELRWKMFVKQFFNLRAFLQQADTQLTPAKFVVISRRPGRRRRACILPLVRVPLVARPAGR